MLPQVVPFSFRFPELKYSATENDFPVGEKHIEKIRFVLLRAG